MPPPSLKLPASRLVVITDLDGTLVDQQSYSYEQSRPAVRRLLQLGIPLVLCSSKTYAEMRPLWDELGLCDPFVVENGGAILVPPNYFPFAAGMEFEERWKIIELGVGVARLRQALTDAARERRVQVRSFASMSLSEIAGLTGLTLNASQRAAERFYDEPFLIDSGDLSCLITGLASRGFSVVKGDRFYHVTGAGDKGKATKVLLDLYRRTEPDIYSVGLGNSANDLPMLSGVNLPVLVRNPDGLWDAEVERQIPGIAKSTKIGPSGWSEMLERILS
ncbi:MAG: HAD-IIB family hydrolase [Candidatus Binatia bacterium]